MIARTRRGATKAEGAETHSEVGYRDDAPVPAVAG
jgi:hypothetical protein